MSLCYNLCLRSAVRIESKVWVNVSFLITNNFATVLTRRNGEIKASLVPRLFTTTCRKFLARVIKPAARCFVYNVSRIYGWRGVSKRYQFAVFVSQSRVVEREGTTRNNSLTINEYSSPINSTKRRRFIRKNSRERANRNATELGVQSHARTRVLIGWLR